MNSNADATVPAQTLALINLWRGCVTQTTPHRLCRPADLARLCISTCKPSPSKRTCTEIRSASNLRLKAYNGFFVMP